MRKDDQPEFRRLAAERRQLKGLEGGGQPGASARLSLSEAFRLLATRPAHSASGNVTLTLNAKGDVQIQVDVPTGDECPTIADASAAAVAVFDALRERYPRGGDE